MIEKTETKTARNGRDNYSSATLIAKRQSRRNDAIDRQVVYEGLTLVERIEQAKSRRGESKREIARIEKLISQKGK